MAAEQVNDKNRCVVDSLSSAATNCICKDIIIIAGDCNGKSSDTMRKSYDTLDNAQNNCTISNEASSDIGVNCSAALDNKAMQTSGNNGDIYSDKEDNAEENSLNILSLPIGKSGKLNSAHPFILLIYFISIVVITMFTLNPIMLALSFFSAVCCCGMLIGGKKLLKSLLYSLPMFLAMALINPIFVHKGETILFFLNSNPVTLEATLYGASSALMLLSVFYWFKCYSILMTSDKVVYLFGRIVPQLSLVLSMSLAFIPKLVRQYKKISNVQKSMGMYASRSIVDKILFRFRVLSSLIGWMLENSIETSDSMHARGYGLKGRSSYAIYKFGTEDKCSLLVITALIFAAVVGLGMSANTSFYPTLNVFDFSASAIVGYVAFGLLSFFGTILEIKENITWRCLISKI